MSLRTWSSEANRSRARAPFFLLMEGQLRQYWFRNGRTWVRYSPAWSRAGFSVWLLVAVTAASRVRPATSRRQAQRNQEVGEQPAAQLNMSLCPSPESCHAVEVERHVRVEKQP